MTYSKIKDTNIQRYYILSTNSINDEDKDFINDKIKEIREKHGCQIIVNGVIKTLKYYLRLIENPDEFIENYVTNLENDTEINYEQKIAWNNIIEGE